MAFEPVVIFQRTDAGMAEIYLQEQDLPKSERLVLATVDGVSTYAELRAKLRIISRSRFNRALRELIKKGLLINASHSTGLAKPHALNPKVMDDFLRGGRADPVVYLSSDESVDSALRAQLELSTKMHVPLPPSDAVKPTVAAKPKVKVKSSRKPTKVVHNFPDLTDKDRRRRQRQRRKETPPQPAWKIYLPYLMLALGLILGLVPPLSKLLG